MVSREERNLKNPAWSEVIAKRETIEYRISTDSHTEKPKANQFQLLHIQLVIANQIRIASERARQASK